MRRTPLGKEKATALKVGYLTSSCPVLRERVLMPQGVWPTSHPPEV